ncbi:MAG: hypothetical protein AAF497_06255, partial [Planctomycetota bacterium]
QSGVTDFESFTQTALHDRGGFHTTGFAAGIGDDSSGLGFLALIVTGGAGRRWCRIVASLRE